MMAALARKEAPAKRAVFNRADAPRRGMIGKIEVARAQLGMAEDDFRQIMFEETGQSSRTNCTVAQLQKVIDRLVRLGFKPLPKKGSTPQAQSPMAKKARALWISLYHLGVVHNQSEAALEAFAKRQLGCDRLTWARQSDGYKLIEALKEWATRSGWPQTTTPLSLQMGLCEAILRRMRRCGLIPQHWQLHNACWQLCGIENAKAGPWTADDYAHAAAALGAKLREFHGPNHGRNQEGGAE